MTIKNYSITFTSKTGNVFTKEYRTNNKRELWGLIKDYKSSFDIKTVVYTEIK